MSTHPVEKQRAETRAPQTSEKRTGLTFRRHFTTAGRHPFDEVTWERRSAVINDEKGQPVFEQHGIEVPTSWSQTATNIVASKYFRGQLGSPDRETSVRGLIARVVDTIGAGDAFGGGFLAWWDLHDHDLTDLDAVREATRFACAVAARTTERPGAQPPRLAELKGV